MSITLIKKTGWRDITLMVALLLCAIFLIGRIVIVYISNPQHFPVRHVKIMTQKVQIPHEKIAAIIQHALDNDSFLTLRSQVLEATLMALPWTKKVSVEKIWPDTLKVTLMEKNPLARWENDFVSEEGALFNAEMVVNTEELPRLKGSRQHLLEVLQVYKKMSKILSPYAFRIAVLEKRDNQAWDLILSNGVKLYLGKQDPEMQLARFCRAYPAVFAKKLDVVDSIDLRYPQGMAVAWKKK